MFSFFSWLGAKFLSKRAVPVVLVLILLAAVFGSCSTDSNEPSLQDKLNGVWIGDGGIVQDKYTINGNTIIYDDGSGEEEWGMSYVGIIKYVTELKGDASGVIIVQYTIPPAGVLSIPNYDDGLIAVYITGDVNTGKLKFATAIDVDNFYAPADVAGNTDLDTVIKDFTGTGYFEKYVASWDYVSDYLKQ